MDNEKAKFILSAYRPDGQDAEDPQFQEALEFVGSDAELARWFAAEQELDRAIAAKLKAAPVPAGLKQTILAGKKVTPIPVWFQRRTLVTLAACLVMTLSASALWYRANHGLNGYRRDMAAMLGKIDSLEYKNPKFDEVRKWLINKGSDSGEVILPDKMDCLSCLGCRVLNWNDKEVTLICFKDPDNELHDTVHLMVIRREDLPGPPPADGTPVFSEIGSLSTASWSDGHYTYMLAVQGKKTQLARFF